MRCTCTCTTISYVLVMIQSLSVEVVIMRCGAPVHIEVAVWRTRLELEHPLLRVLLHQGEDLHKDDGDGGSDAHGHNVLLFLRKWTRFKWIEGKTKDKIDFRWLDEKHFNCSFTNRNGDVEIWGIVRSAHYSICNKTSCLELVKMVTMHFSQAQNILPWPPGAFELFRLYCSLRGQNCRWYSRTWWIYVIKKIWL